MKTETLIEALAAAAEPAPARGLERRLALAAAAAALLALVAVLVLLGPGPRVLLALSGPVFWMKAAYTALLAASGVWLLFRLGRPGASARAPALALGAVLALALFLGGAELLTTPAQGRMHVWLGHSWSHCARTVAGLGLLSAPALFLGARRLAPTRPALAGAAAGFAAGAMAATLYGLYCTESTAAFVATWYTLGAVATGAAGALVGRFWFRW